MNFAIIVQDAVRLLSRIGLVGLVIPIAIGCESLKTREQMEEEAPLSSTTIGPPAPSTYTPTPIAIDVVKKRTPKLGLILGPGGVKALAHIGVLAALQKEKIPVSSIVGLEWGAWIGAYYAQAGHPQDAEWSLAKLKAEDLPQKKGLFSSTLEPVSVNSLGDFFNSSFHQPDLAKMKIPMACPVVSLQNGKVLWQHQGDVRDALRKCLPFPPLLAPQVAGYYAGASEVVEATKYLKARGAELVVLVDVMPAANALPRKLKEENPSMALLYHSLGRELALSSRVVDEVILVPTGMASVLSLDQRRELIRQGGQMGALAAKRLAKKYGY